MVASSSFLGGEAPGAHAGMAVQPGVPGSLEMDALPRPGPGHLCVRTPSGDPAGPLASVGWVNWSQREHRTHHLFLWGVRPLPMVFSICCPLVCVTWHPGSSMHNLASSHGNFRCRFPGAGTAGAQGEEQQVCGLGEGCLLQCLAPLADNAAGQRPLSTQTLAGKPPKRLPVTSWAAHYGLRTKMNEAWFPVLCIQSLGSRGAEGGPLIIRANRRRAGSCLLGAGTSRSWGVLTEVTLAEH